MALLSRLPKYYHFFGFHLEALDSALNSIEPDNQTAFSLLQAISKDYNFYSRNPFGSQMKGEKPTIAPVVYTQPEPVQPVQAPSIPKKQAQPLNLTGMKMVSKATPAQTKTNGATAAQNENLMDLDFSGNSKTPSRETNNSKAGHAADELLNFAVNETKGPTGSSSVNQKNQNDDHLLNFSISNTSNSAGAGSMPMSANTGFKINAGPGMYQGGHQGGYQMSMQASSGMSYGGYNGPQTMDTKGLSMASGSNLVDILGNMSIQDKKENESASKEQKQDAFDFLDF